jgi:hypothetical protein
MLNSYKLGQGSVILRIKIRDSSKTDGSGLTGLTYSTANLVISTIADTESSATIYSQATSTIEGISSLGTFATPTATKCRFKEVDNTNLKGIYEIQLDNTRYAVSNSKSMIVTIFGATNVTETDAFISLVGIDPYASVVQSQLANVAHGGASATLTMTNIDVNNPSGDAVHFHSTGGDGSGLRLDGNGAGHGLNSIAGATGKGIRGAGGTGSGDGIYGQAGSTGGGGIIGNGLGGVNITAPAGMSTLTVGAQMDLVNAPNSTAVTAIQSGLMTTAGYTAPDNASIATILSVVNGLQVLPKNVACPNFPVKLVLSSDHNTPATGKTVSGFISKDGVAFVALTIPTCTEIGLGAYKVNISQAEMNADFILLAFTAAGCDQRMFGIKTQA